MDVKLLSKLVKLINPKTLYEFEFNDIKETKTGKDWIGTFVSSNKNITNENGQILIQHFTQPLEESHILNQQNI
jgi:hypothetical protein